MRRLSESEKFEIWDGWWRVSGCGRSVAGWAGRCQRSGLMRYLDMDDLRGPLWDLGFGGI